MSCRWRIIWSLNKLPTTTNFKKGECMKNLWNIVYRHCCLLLLLLLQVFDKYYNYHKLHSNYQRPAGFLFSGVTIYWRHGEEGKGEIKCKTAAVVQRSMESLRHQFFLSQVDPVPTLSEGFPTQVNCTGFFIQIFAKASQKVKKSKQYISSNTSNSDVSELA